VPETCLEIFRAFQKVTKTRASELQARLTPLATAVTTRFGIGGLKAALDLAGYHGGAVRAPLRAPDETARAEIAALLKDVLQAAATQVDAEPHTIRNPAPGWCNFRFLRRMARQELEPFEHSRTCLL
jgi:hypothetical protein